MKGKKIIMADDQPAKIISAEHEEPHKKSMLGYKVTMMMQKEKGEVIKDHKKKTVPDEFALKRTYSGALFASCCIEA